jgi:hypothetical protein
VIFGLGVDNQMFHWNGRRDATWVALGGKFASPPVAVSRPKGPTDVFALGFDQQIYHKVYDGTLWTPEWESLGGSFITPPAAVSWAWNRVDLFALGPGSQMFHRAWDGFQWLPSGTWEALGGVFSSPPAAVSWGPNRLDIFGLGVDNTMFHKSWDGSRWLPSATGWEQLGTQTFTSPPAATSRVNRLDVFAIGTHNQMSWIHWDDGLGWSSWLDFGEVFNSAPVAVAVVADPTRPWRLDLLGFGADNQVLHRSLSVDDFAVHAWETLEGKFINP